MNEVIVCETMQALPCPTVQEEPKTEEKPIDPCEECPTSHSDDMAECETCEDSPTIEKPKTEKPTEEIKCYAVGCIYGKPKIDSLCNQCEYSKPSPSEQEKPKVPETPKTAMFKTEDAKLFRDLFNLISVLQDEATFQIDKDKIRVRLMDPTRIGMINVDVPRNAFMEYDVSEAFKFCFNVDDFSKKVFKNLHKGETLTFNVDTGKVSGPFIVKLQQKNMRKFTFPLLEGSDEEIPNPKIMFDSKVRLVLDDLNDLLKDVEDHIFLTASNDDLKIKMNGDISAFEATLEKGGSSILEIECRATQGQSKACFNVPYLKEFLAALNKVCDIALIELASDMPMHIDAQLQAGITIDYWQAPRIQNE